MNIYIIMNNDELIQTFVSLTGKDYGKALSILENQNWDLQKALNVENNIEINDNIRAPDNTTNMRLIDNFETNIFEQHLEDISFGNEPDYMNNNESFDKIKLMAKKEKKHILVSILDDNLDSIQINTILWKKENVEDVIVNQFICYQCNSFNTNGKLIIERYQISKFPYVFLIDYETYENIYTFKNIKDDNDFICEIFNYLEPEELPIIKIEEPNENDKNVFIIKFSFVQTNKKKERRFKNTEYIQTIYNYISQEFELKDFKLLLRYPKKDLITEKSKTLQDLNLNNCIIIVDTNI